MNVAANIILLSILTLVASRHVHAYRISRRRRTGSRTTFRRTTADSASTSMPQCDPTTCCSLNVCLKYMIHPEILCPRQDPEEEIRFKRDSLLSDSTWPFIKQTSETNLRFPPGWLPASSSSLSSSSSSSSSSSTQFHHDHTFIQLTEEQEFIARTYYGRFFRRRDQLPSIPSDVFYSNADSPSNYPKRTSEGVRTKRSLSYVCPRNEQWEDIMLAINADDQLVQMVQLSDSRQWLLTESCQYAQSPTVSDVLCQEVTRLVTAVVVDTVTSQVQHQYIKVHCCVGVQVE